MENISDIIKKQNNFIDNKEEEEEEKQLVCFLIGTEEYGVSILNIQEIIKPLPFTRVPQTHNYILGVFNLRGSVIPLIDLRIKFNSKNNKISEDTRFIVIKNKQTTIGFVIDNLTTSERILSKNIDYSIRNESNEKSLVEGVAKLNDKIITVLNVDKLLLKDN